MIRALLVLALAALVVLIFYGMWRGWVHRQRRQSDLPPFPVMPEGISAPELLPAETGLYVGTTYAGDWQDRIAVGDIGHRANATARLWPEGLLLEREGASPLWIPRESVVDARVDHKLANKVVPGAGLWVVSWRHGDRVLDTGFRPDEKETQEQWAKSIATGEAQRDENVISGQEEQR